MLAVGTPSHGEVASTHDIAVVGGPVTVGRQAIQAGGINGRASYHAVSLAFASQGLPRWPHAPAVPLHKAYCANCA